MSQVFQILVTFAILAALQVQGFLLPTYSSGYNGYYDCYGYDNGYGYGNGGYGGYGYNDGY